MYKIGTLPGLDRVLDLRSALVGMINSSLKCRRGSSASSCWACFSDKLLVIVMISRSQSIVYPEYDEEENDPDNIFHI